MIFVAGVYVTDGAGAPVFRAVRSPDTAELQAMVQQLGERIGGLLDKRGLIDGGGSISLGEIPPIPCAAIATEGHNGLAMLRRRPGERLDDLLVRLDEAIGVAGNEGCFAVEINPPRPAKSIRR
jgi:hypothetical protein